MKTARRRMFGTILRFVLVAAMLALPVQVTSAQPEPEKAGAQPAEPKKESAEEVSKEPEAQTKEAVTPDAPHAPTLVDPETGKLLAADKVPPEKIVKLPPGDVRGKVLEADGLTPHSGVKIILMDAKTSEVLATTTTDDEGAYVLKDVQEGRYVVLVGNPGIGAILQVTEGAEPAALTIVVPEAAWFRWPSWAPQWMQAYPVLAVTVVAGVGIIVVTATYVFIIRKKRRQVLISPIVP